MRPRPWSTLGWTFSTLVACTPPTPPELPDAPTTADQDPLAHWTVPALPDWTDRYADTNGPEHRFLRIERLMSEHALDRARAVEVQNHFRDLLRKDPRYSAEAALDLAVKRAKAGEFEDGRAVETLAGAPFIVVFDLDDTLYDQYYAAGEDCHDLSFTDLTGAHKYVKLHPGWKRALTRIHELGGAVVFFSANLDDVIQDNLSHWMWDEVNVLERKEIGALLTNSHLVQQEKTDGPGAENPRKGWPVLVPSKDLRILDESLTRVILVDDNPARVIQRRNLRRFPKFDADQYCADPDGPVGGGHGRTLAAVLRELEESLAWQAEHASDFVTAFLPYTEMGEVYVDYARWGLGLDESRARDWVRAHPDAVPARF